MRTRALLCLAAVAAIPCFAQGQNVYSANVVGYINVAVPANQYVLIANQLNTTNNTIANVLAGMPGGAIFQKFSAAGYSAYNYDDLDNAWVPDGNATLNPGEGGFFRSPVATTVTFVGEVMQGSLTNALPAAGVYGIRSSIVPQAGGIGSLGFPAEGGDIIQTYNNGFTAANYDDLDAAWTPAEPNIGLGQSFFVKKSPTATQLNWVRNFTVQ
jgi:hypothetical protein